MEMELLLAPYLHILVLIIPPLRRSGVYWFTPVFCSFEEFQAKYNTKLNFIGYYGILSAIQLDWRQKKMTKILKSKVLWKRKEYVR